MVGAGQRTVLAHPTSTGSTHSIGAATGATSGERARQWPRCQLPLVLPAVAAGWHCSWQSLPSHTGAFSPSVTKAKERSLLQETAVANIVQASRVFHTGAKAMERLLLRPQFDGPVTAGKAYVLVDDVICLGGTLAELADYIQAGGGQVAAVVTLVNAGRIKRLKP